MTISAMLSQMARWGVDVRVEAAAGGAVGKALVCYPRTDRPLRADEAKNLMRLIRAREADAIRVIECPPREFVIPPSPEATRARIAELEADLAATWTGGTADAIKVYELNALHWLDLRPGATEHAVTGETWMALYLEAQQ
jgi:hypothetical protein